MRIRITPLRAVLAVAALIAAIAPAAIAGTAIKPYAISVAPQYSVTPLWSADDRVPETSNPSQQYRMVGIPDGLGGYRNPDGTSTVYMNHELTNSTMSEPVIGGPQNRGAFVSRLVVDAQGNVVSGERAYDTVYMGDTLVGPAADSTNATSAFGRFCSGSLAPAGADFDRPIYFTNEEATGAASFQGTGGYSVAIFDNELHTLPRLGRFNKENTVVEPDTGKRTVIISLEDGPTTPDSQLYMYVGEKDKKASSVLGKNGLDNGILYVFRSTTSGATNEATFGNGSITGEWAPIPNAQTLTPAQLESAADAAGAFGFVRIEDGTFRDGHKGDFYFVTTGESAGPENKLGRLYHLSLHPGSKPEDKPATLEVVYNADRVVGAGGDIAISPDNVTATDDALFVQEDGTSDSRPVMGAKGRDGSIWRFPLHGSTVDVAGRQRVVQLNPPGRDGAPVGPGEWETSGIIDASALFGTGTWLFDVQAHSPTAAPAAGTVEDGQLLLLTRTA